ncbi:MAG: hypothetical protein AABZ74_16570 [Cyanobacteriota bacterium]
MGKFSSKTFLLMGLSSLFFACSSPNDMTQADLNENNSTISANVQKPVKNDVSGNFTSLSFAKQIASALDINKDGKVDATEVPFHVGGGPKNTLDYKYNYNSSSQNYAPTQAMSVDEIANSISQGGDLSIYGSKLSEKNKEKIASNLANVLVKDPSNDGGKVYGFASNIGYFTGKTTARVRSLDSSSITKRILEQVNIGSGTINGVPYQTSNGHFTILSSYMNIDNKYKSKLHFTYYDYFNSGIQIFGSYSISDASSKLVRQ